LLSLDARSSESLELVGMISPSWPTCECPEKQKKHFQYDVKWGPINQKNVIATAGTNGTICLYDTKEGKLDRTLREHGRQVHRLAFNQANGNLLLSASQDGTVKLWDLREKKSRHTFVGKADAVRDVQFNAGNATEFAAAFDNGTIQVCPSLIFFRIGTRLKQEIEMGLSQPVDLRAEDQRSQRASICRRLAPRWEALC
jgi:WD40 repeat protein